MINGNKITKEKHIYQFKCKNCGIIGTSSLFPEECPSCEKRDIEIANFPFLIISSNKKDLLS